MIRNRIRINIIATIRTMIVTRMIGMNIQISMYISSSKNWSTVAGNLQKKNTTNLEHSPQTKPCQWNMEMFQRELQWQEWRNSITAVSPVLTSHIHFFCQMSRSRPVLPEVFSWLKVFSKMSTNLPASTAHGSSTTYLIKEPTSYISYVFFDI